MFLTTKKFNKIENQKQSYRILNRLLLVQHSQLLKRQLKGWPFAMNTNPMYANPQCHHFHPQQIIQVIREKINLVLLVIEAQNWFYRTAINNSTIFWTHKAKTDNYNEKVKQQVTNCTSFTETRFYNCYCAKIICISNC
jgi:hypothetical protein